MPLLEMKVAVSPVARVERLADLAVEALIDEAILTPKPGLVDRRGGGVHADMDVELMITSARALRPTFHALATTGRRGRDNAALRAELARIGRRGEAAMERATAGVNTHRGAIWALGLSIAAAASSPTTEVADVMAKVAAIAAHEDPASQSSSVRTKGAGVRARYGVTGAIGEARSGFRHAQRALDALRAGRAAGVTENVARVDALLVSIAGLEDTCVLGRGGPAALRRVQHGASRILRLGGADTAAGMAAMTTYEHDLTRRRLSPGGSADMLALALFLDRVCPAPQPDRRREK